MPLQSNVFLAQGGPYGGPYYDALQWQSSRPQLIFSAGTMVNSGLVISFWIFASSASSAGSSNFVQFGGPNQGKIFKIVNKNIQ